MERTIVIPYSQWRAFLEHWNTHNEWRAHLRLGQAFYNWANLHKMTQTPWLDKLYNADFDITMDMVNTVMDWEN